MKTLLRTVVILAAALVVVGAALAFAGSGYAAGMREARPGRGAFIEGQAGRPERGSLAPRGGGAAMGGEGMGRRIGGEPGRAGHDHHGPSLAGLGEVGKNLAIVGVIVALGALPGRLWRRRRQPPGRASAA